MLEQVTVSSRIVARLVANLAKPKLSPVAEAAAKHEPKVKSLLLKAVKKTRAAVSMRELESVLIFGGSGAPLYVLEETLKVWERELLGDGVEPAPTNWLKMRAAGLHCYWNDESGEVCGQCPGCRRMRAAADKNDLPSVLNAALVSGAGAAEVCVRPTAFNITHGEGVAQGHVDNVKKTLSRLPPEFILKTNNPTISVVKQAVDLRTGKPVNVAGLFTQVTKENWQVQIVAGKDPFHLSSTVVHELGHAFETATKSNITDAFLLDVKMQNAATFGSGADMDLVHAKEWWPHYRTSEREAFAQSVAHIFGHGGDMMDAYAKAFPNSIAATRKALIAHGVKLP